MHLDGKPIRSCVTPVGSAVGHKITTLEGLAATYHGRQCRAAPGETSSGTAGMDRRAGAAVRELPERMDHVLGPSACHRSQTHGQSDPSGTERAQVPLWLAGGNPSCGPARCESDGGGVMEEKDARNAEEVTAEKKWRHVQPPPVHPGYRRARRRVFDRAQVRRGGVRESRGGKASFRTIQRLISTRWIRLLRSMAMGPCSSKSARSTTDRARRPPGR